MDRNGSCIRAVPDFGLPAKRLLCGKHSVSGNFPGYDRKQKKVSFPAVWQSDLTKDHPPEAAGW